MNEIVEKLEVERVVASPIGRPLRILAVSKLIQGANDYAFVRAFRRAGHSVTVVPHDSFVPTWQSAHLRALRRLMAPVFVQEFNSELIAAAEHLRPDLFFVFKGQYVTPQAMAAIKATGAIAINFYPDTGYADQGPYLPKTIAMHDWVFTTKPAGVADLANRHNFTNASFLPHAFDPETHAPVQLDRKDRRKYQCDVSFIGDRSLKKQRSLEYIRRCLPDISLRIWGQYTWCRAPSLDSVYQGAPIFGMEYAKAIQASQINLGLLFEGGPSAPEGDVITSRTFHIPAAGGFMLHERSKAAMEYFEEGKECAFYSDHEELVTKIVYYLKHPDERERIAKAGRQRALSSTYSVDARVATVLAKFAELRDLRNERA